MDLSENVGDRKRLARTALTVVLTVVALDSLRKGKRLVGALAAAGAVALGYRATSGSGDREGSPAGDRGASPGVTTSDGAAGEEAHYEFRCAACGQPILPGQARGPNANDEIVHETCEASS